MKTVRLTMTQALVRHLSALRVEMADGSMQPYVGGVFSIFGHGNVAGLGEALWAERAELPTLRAHNEQAMAHAAIAFAKAQFRQRIMAVTTSIGPGATNLVTAAALAHVNRLPVLLLPGDVFASRAPDPVLQQVEDFHHGDVSANDCLRPVTRYFDRLMRPEQILAALPRAIQVMTDPALCGPVCLALPQDVQTQAFDCPEGFLQPGLIRFRRPPADAGELQRVAALLKSAKRPLIVAGGGVLYSQAFEALRDFAQAHGVPVAESQAGKGSLPWDHALNAGAIGVTGSPAANALARDADVILAVGTRLQDFTTGSHTLFGQAKLIGLNVQALDAAKWHGASLVADARVGLQQLGSAVEGWKADAGWTARTQELAQAWRERVTQLTTAEPQGELPYDAEVIGAVRDSTASSATNDIVVCAAGTLPAELHKLWRAGSPGSYHMEYGYSCMGYEIAGGLGVKIARPQQEVIVMVGDGSYMMMNSEIATSVMLGRKLIVVVLDNRGYGCIHRLQRASGGERFNNLLDDCVPEGGSPSSIDFAAHAASMGAEAVHVAGVRELKAAMVTARAARKTQVIVIDTTPERTTDDGGCWWEVAIPEVSARAEVRDAQARYITDKTQQTLCVTRTLTVKPWNVRIGINPISWSNDDLPALGGETSLETALKEGAEIGYQGFELGNKFPKEPAALKAKLADYGVACVSGWYSGRLAEGTVEDEVRDAVAHMSKLQYNDCKVVVYGEVAGSVQGQIDTPLAKRPRFSSEAQWLAYGERLTAFGKHLQSTYGITLAYHHHMGAYVESPDDIDHLMAVTGDSVGLLFDTGHAYYGGAKDPVALLKKHLKRVVHVHCKDVRPEVVAQARNDGWSFLHGVINGTFTVPGDGVIDFNAVLSTLHAGGYEGWLVVEAEQDPAVAPSYAYAKKGFDTLKGLVTRLSA